MRDPIALLPIAAAPGTAARHGAAILLYVSSEGMPDLGLSEPDARDVTAYLETLR